MAPLPPAPARDSRSPLEVTLRGGEAGVLVSPLSSWGSEVGGMLIRLGFGAEVGPAPAGSSEPGVEAVTSAMVGTLFPDGRRPLEGMRAPSGAAPK